MAPSPSIDRLVSMAPSPSIDRLVSLWSGLPSCAVIVFRHLQKTGGTSILRQFQHLQADLQFS